MGASKVYIFSDQINEIAQFAKVFAHPARIAIIKFISEQEGCICNDIVEEIGLSQATISQHLTVIGNIGLLKGTFEGKKKCYCLNVERYNEIRMQLDSFFKKTTLNCC
ncbi:metalloregulator ArsR/SmtB family transcription factor [Psychroserpens sp.]|uniref:ArsR/SmtB family transcription factor n=1 Tax=Psychroserpens sp. TaxID=2020870 RepID=UPI001B2CBDB0|nr:metalloregulator ArsR/SmtB family transcription factor [Psychroserpens sp.]MBO6607720.1 winged helix-turn-helix transcriptional regulator [Psychroserpens sp.]MBO6630926.1 winged helix-turn-helix transcriptional regulator [Psychroserpens sp.]MBO6654711.1 winged helix-turn-helix transcriptional regulator [Psychroserpens sp.]MBO6682865.1 winged helix-turn-helix transcriptional regulator [Psychroserpens sp.]MBO6751078.1 winged helix-turn-helix transcriptional regulator [Psychroserpens sp.]